LGVCDAEVRVEAIRPQKRSNPSVPVRQAPRAFVGQVFNLRPVSNRPPASVRQCRKGRLQARRRLETCPTKHTRIDRPARPVRWKLCAVLTGFPFVAFAASKPAGHVWPEAPGGTLSWAIALLLLALAWLGLSLRSSYRRHSAPGSAELFDTSRSRAKGRGPARWILIAAAVLLCGLLAWGWVDRLIPFPILAGLVKCAGVILLSALIISGREIAAVLVVPPAWRAGDYDRALRSIRRLSFGWPSAKLVRMEGITHGLAGRPAEAERCYREALARGQDSPRSERAGMLGCLAESLEDQGRFGESLNYRQAAIDMGDNILGSARHGLAEALLRQGTDPQRALEQVDEAMRVAKGQAAPQVAPSRSATRAWALAVLGRRQEAERAIAQAMLLRRETHAALFADTRLKVGMALLAMEQPENAIEQFRAAYEADPKGKIGARARYWIDRNPPGPPPPSMPEQS